MGVPQLGARLLYKLGGLAPEWGARLRLDRKSGVTSSTCSGNYAASTRSLLSSGERGCACGMSPSLCPRSGSPVGGLPPRSAVCPLTLSSQGQDTLAEGSLPLCPRAGSPLLEATLLGSAVMGFFVELTSVRVDTSGLGGHCRRGRSPRRPPASPEVLDFIGKLRRRLVLGCCFARPWPGS